MEKLNEYLQSLLSTCSYELHLEPNKTPYVLNAGGMTEVSKTPLLGTQISTIIFPLIPPEAKQHLPNKPEIEFIHSHNLGNFSFLVKKSPAGFNVIIRPLFSDDGVSKPSYSPHETHNTSPAESPNYYAPPKPVSSFANIIEEKNTAQEKKNNYLFGNVSSDYEPSVETESNFEIEVSGESISEVETVSVYDPEFVTSFSDNATYEPPLRPQEFKMEYENPASSHLQKPVQEEKPHLLENFEHYEDLPQSNDLQSPKSSIPASASGGTGSQMQTRMDNLFRLMEKAGASDLHLSVSMPPMIRKDGKMMKLESSEGVLTPASMKELLYSIMPKKNQEEFERRHDTDFAYEIADLARFRANIFADRKGMGGVFRVIPTKILTAEQLGLSKSIMDLCQLSKGLVVVTGPTGSGKSTTLCAMVDSINKNREDHIITIEDPIEFTHENQKCLVNQREVHNHTDSFKDALRAALREDPDIVLVGEMRDLETIAIAIETAETGHLVFGTLHTTTAISTIDRIIDQFPADRQQQVRVMLSESLRGVIAQTLLPKKGGGRIAALEVLIITPAISNLIREGKTFQIASSMQTGKVHGMVMLNDALLDLVKKGLVEPRDAYIKAVDKSGFESLLKREGLKI
jgi:twitching motility protein PilT